MPERRLSGGASGRYVLLFMKLWVPSVGSETRHRAGRVAAVGKERHSLRANAR
jgi:hypothetical protein